MSRLGLMLGVIVSFLVAAALLTGTFLHGYNSTTPWYFKYKKPLRLGSLPYTKLPITIVTLETRDVPYMAMHNRSMGSYAELHGYRYVFLDYYGSRLPVYWQKLQVVQDLLKSDPHDVSHVCWADSDSVVVHPEIPLEQLLGAGKNLCVHIGSDYPGWSTTYNAGFFIVENSREGRLFVDSCLEMYLGREECLVNGCYTLTGAWSGRCYEQGIMNELLKREPFCAMVYHIPRDFANSAPFFDPSTVISHVFGPNKSFPTTLN